MLKSKIIKQSIEANVASSLATVAANELAGQTIVIKIGGSALQCPTAAKMLSQDVAAIVAQGAKVVLVHGGGPAITEQINASGKQCQFVQGLRVTDEEVLAVAGKVLDSINSILTTELKGFGVDALGIDCSSNSELLTARKKWILEPSGAKLDIGWVGEVDEVNADAFLSILAEGGVPVCVSLVKDAQGKLYNVNADNVAMAIAVKLKADKLVYLTDVPGILMDGVVLSDVTIDELSMLIDCGIIKGGMIPKVRSCALGIRKGIQSVIITSADAQGELFSSVIAPGQRGTVLSIGDYELLEKTA